MTLTHCDILENGTKIYVNGKRGIIVSYKECKDQFGGKIIVHQVLLTERFSHKKGTRNGIASVYTPIINPKPESVNYSSICVPDK